MPIGAFVSAGRSLEQALDRVRLAEQLGFESVWVTHLNTRDSLTLLAIYAGATRRVRLGTGVVPIYSRTPATMAQTAATIDEASGGRLVLGMGVSHRPVVEGWHGQTIDRPVSEMREYVAILRAVFAGQEPPAGEKFRTGFSLGMDVRPDLPIHVAALSPRMLRLAGEVADGVVLWLCNPHYVRDVVVPEVRAGREAAGRPLEGFEIVAAVPSALTDDREAAYGAMRRELLTYFGLPFYRAMLERSGFGDDIARFDAAAGRGDAEAMGAAIGDGFLDVLTAVGDAGDVERGVERYVHAGVTSACVGPIPKTDFSATLDAAAPVAARHAL